MKIALWLPKYDVPLDDPCCYPLGFMYISSALKAAGHDVTVFNNNLWDYSFSCVLDFDVVCLTGFESFDNENRFIIDLCKRKGVHTIIGGASATFGQITADATVIGEGETAVLKVLRRGGIAAELPDIHLPIRPDYEGFGIDEYHSRHSHRYMGILTSRGCPHNCTFCAHTCRFRCRRFADVFAEVDDYISRYKIEMLVVNDNTLNSSKGRFRQFCEGMRERKIAWSAALRVDNLDDSLVKLARDSGMIYSVVGVESFNQRKLDMMNKKITVEQIENGLGLLEKYGIRYHSHVILGFDGETDEDVQREFDDMKSRPHRLFPVLLQPFIGINAKTSTINRRKFSAEFGQYISERNMYMYPETI